MSINFGKLWWAFFTILWTMQLNDDSISNNGAVKMIVGTLHTFIFATVSFQKLIRVSLPLPVSIWLVV